MVGSKRRRTLILGQRNLYMLKKQYNNNKKCKILLFHQSGAIGGAGLSLLHILDALDKDKYEIKVVCPSIPEDMCRLINEHGVEVIATDSTPIIFPHYNGGIKYALSIRTLWNLVCILRDKPKVNKILEQSAPDIVIVNSMTMFMIGRYAKLKGIKTICFHRETYQKGLFGVRTNYIKRQLSYNFDKIVFISEYDKESTKPCNAKKYVVYDKVDTSLYSNTNRQALRQEYGIQENEKCILFLGGISKIKGGYIAINAMNHLERKDIKLIFVGISKKQFNTPLSIKERILASIHMSGFAMSKKAYHTLKNNDRIIFVPISKTPEKYYCMADAVIFPSIIAHQARPIYEAGIARIPILISNFHETAEFVKNNYNAILFEPNNTENLAQKINDLFDNHCSIKKIVENNYELSVKNHNLKDLKDELSIVFENI